MPRPSKLTALAKESAPEGGVSSVDKACSLLLAFAAGDTRLTLTELAQRTQLYKSTAMRLLASLEHAGFIRRLADGSYSLGASVARLNPIYFESFPLEDVVVPVLRELVRATGESAAFQVPQGSARLTLFKIDSPHPIREHVRRGELHHGDRGAGARVLIAFGWAGHPPAARDAALYKRIREAGYFAGVGDRLPEVAGIGAPVFVSAEPKRVGAAIVLSMPAHRYSEDHIGAVVESARRITANLPRGVLDEYSAA